MKTEESNDLKNKGRLCSKLHCLMCNDPINEDCVLEQQIWGIKFVHQRLDQVLKNRVEEAKIMGEITEKISDLVEIWSKKINNAKEE